MDALLWVLRLVTAHTLLRCRNGSDLTPGVPESQAIVPADPKLLINEDISSEEAFVSFGPSFIHGLVKAKRCGGWGRASSTNWLKDFFLFFCQQLLWEGSPCCSHVRWLGKQCIKSQPQSHTTVPFALSIREKSNDVCRCSSGWIPSLHLLCLWE